MKLEFIDIGNIDDSAVNMRHGRKAPDVSDILPTVRKRGIIVPVILRAGVAEGRFELVAGRRRVHAARIAQADEGADPELGRVPQIMQVELTDEDGGVWFMDQAERFNAFNFNSFQGWLCDSGYRSIVIREPDGSIKRSYSCWDEPLGYIETGFTLFPERKPCITPTCVSSADSKIPKRRL